MGRRNSSEKGQSTCQLSPGWSHHRSPHVPSLPCLGTDVSMFPLPCCAPEGGEPKCMGLPGLWVKGAGEPLGPWAQPLGTHPLPCRNERSSPRHPGYPGLSCMLGLVPKQRGCPGCSVGARALLGQHGDCSPYPCGSKMGAMLTAKPNAVDQRSTAGKNLHPASRLWAHSGLFLLCIGAPG